MADRGLDSEKLANRDTGRHALAGSLIRRRCMSPASLDLSSAICGSPASSLFGGFCCAISVVKKCAVCCPIPACKGRLHRYPRLTRRAWRKVPISSAISTPYGMIMLPICVPKQYTADANAHRIRPHSTPRVRLILSLRLASASLGNGMTGRITRARIIHGQERAMDDIDIGSCRWASLRNCRSPI